jgi:hypothetical protein
LLRLVLAGKFDEARRFSRAGAQRVDADAAILEIENPVAGEVTDRGFRCGIDAEGGRARGASG